MRQIKAALEAYRREPHWEKKTSPRGDFVTCIANNTIFFGVIHTFDKIS
jgi:hypothetical protein